MCHNVGLVRIDVSEECVVSIFKVQEAAGKEER
jgi:hypothetical protein